jgi:hypothetical protein
MYQILPFSIQFDSQTAACLNRAMTEDGNRPPRWVTVSAAAVALLVLGFVVLHLAGFGMAGMH